MPPICTPKTTCRDQLLDSAEEVVLRAGFGSLTLDAVAAHAKVSKGGLLYHFPSKDALIVAMVQRTCDNWRKDYSEAIAAEPAGPGRVPRALLKMCMGTPESCDATCRRSSVVMVAAIANNPELAAPLRRTYEDLWSRLREERSSAAAGEAVVLALNGLWFEQVFGLREMPAERLESIRSALMRLIDDGQAGSKAEGAAGGRGGNELPARKRVAKSASGVRKPSARRGSKL